MGRAMLRPLLVSLLLWHTAAQSDGGQFLRDFTDDKERIVKELAAAAEEAYKNRQVHVRDCVCSRHSCSNSLGKNAKCFGRLGSSSLCGSCEGTLLDYTRSAVRLAPGTDPRNLTAQVKESLCTFRQLNRIFPKLNVETWSYIGTTDGTFRTYPIRQRLRSPQGEKLLQGCASYDPRLRPWYISASTGPKDVVLLIDTSGSMDGPAKTSRWDLTRESLSTLLATFTPSDFVNIVTFSSDAKVLLPKRPLHPGTDKNRKRFDKALKKVVVNGGTDFNKGFNKAFDLLEEALEESRVRTTSTCTKIIIFLTDGMDCSTGTSSECSLSREDGPERLLANIGERQEQLEESTGSRASIFTLSMGKDADDSIPRQIACANDGTWSFFEDGTDPILSLNSYYTFLAAGRDSDGVTWAEPYEDASGLGTITTVAKAIFSPPGKDGTKGVQIGVVGHDVMLSELDATQKSLDVVSELASLSRNCDSLKLEPCRLQAQRDQSFDHATCPDRLPKEKCYEFLKRWYARIDTRMDQPSAQKECEAKGGNLVSVRSDEHLAFVAAVAAPRGSWVGATRKRLEPTQSYEWIDDLVDDFDATSDFWGSGEPHDNEAEAAHCVTIDPRGVKRNMVDRSCRSEFSFICEFDSPPAFCGKSVETVDPKSFYEVPPLSQCRDEEDIVSRTRPVNKAKSIDSKTALCGLGKEEPIQELMCCEDCPKDGDFDKTQFRWPFNTAANLK